MRKNHLFFAALLLAGSVFSAFKLPPPEHYCKNDRAMNTGICGILTDGTAVCHTVTGATVNKDCYDQVNY